MKVVYDEQFNKNEWFIIISLVIEIALIWKHKDRFAKKELFVYLLMGIFSGILFDKTISIEPFEFYDANDSSAYEFMDFLSYLAYGPIAYFYIYFYDYYKTRFGFAPYFIPSYVLAGAVVSVFLELIAVHFGVYHYKNGYTTFYSFLVYLAVLSFYIYVYNNVHLNEA